MLLRGRAGEGLRTDYWVQKVTGLSQEQLQDYDYRGQGLTGVVFRLRGVKSEKVTTYISSEKSCYKEQENQVGAGEGCGSKSFCPTGPPTWGGIVLQHVCSSAGNDLVEKEKWITREKNRKTAEKVSLNRPGRLGSGSQGGRLAWDKRIV